MKKTPLYDWHVSHGAKMVEFGGWMMPVSYSGVLSEHQAVRDACGLFDISHMGEIWISGKAAEGFLQGLTTNDVKRLGDGAAQYSLLLNESGFVLDDINVYRFSPERFMLCVNASYAPKDFQRIQGHATGELQVSDASDATGMIALQGPKSPQVLSSFGIDLQKIPRFHFVETRIADLPLTLSRTGYTGEAGVEIFCPAAATLPLWERLLEAGRPHGIQPIGLGARDTLRLEMAYPLYGHEISDAINPLEAGLAWVVRLEKGEFLGRGALLRFQEAGIRRKLVGVLMSEPGIPRADLQVIHKGEVVGRVLSGTFSPSLQQGIVTAIVVRVNLPETGEILIDIRGKMKKAKIVPVPFYKK